jgi:SWI/SNF-related matrix-associated actin-dependent regulator 1 of chromatin subfamily A
LSGLKLDDYQEVSRDFLLGRVFAGLWDLPGVGKTAPAIMAAWQKHSGTGLPVLITCPSYLCPNWAWEISRFAPEATVSVANGSGSLARKSALTAETDFVITGYPNWSAKSKTSWTYPELHERLWAALVFDESHKLRGRSSQCTKHVQELRRARAVNKPTPIWCLSGTPVVNNPGDLYPLLNLWDPKTYRSYWRFVNDWCIVTETPWKTEVGQLRKGLDEEWQELIGRFSLRRTLKDIPKLQSLEELHHDYFVDMPASVKATIKKARKEYIVEHPDLESTEFVNGGGALYSKLRQLVTNPPTKEKPKIDFCREFLDIHDEPVCIYTWYRASARAVSEGLAKTGRPVTLITGDVPTSSRSSLVDQWKETDNGILIATISSLREGISLTHASNVIFLESSELSADMEQVVARLKRRGQTELVQVHWVWARNSPDISIKRAVRDREIGIRRALVSWLREE